MCLKNSYLRVLHRQGKCILTGTELKSSNIIADNERGHLDFGGLPSKSNHLNVHIVFS